MPPIQSNNLETFDPIAYINTPRWQQVKPGLERIEELLERLGRPQDDLRFVHVAGTNGKGSVCAYIARVLQEAGYRTGLFTSPYIERFEERIRVNGADISPDNLRAITLDVRDAAEQCTEHPTEFELMCAVGLLHFARSACDIVVLEVGLGGRLDATNIINAPEVCVICRLGLDHTGILGTTLEEIAAEKAGIVKPGCRVVSWPQEPDPMAVVERVCAEQGAPLTCADFNALDVKPLSLESMIACGVKGTAAAQGAASTTASTAANTRDAENTKADAAADATKIKAGTTGDAAADAAANTRDAANTADAAADETPIPLRTFTYRGRTVRTRLLASYQPYNAALALDVLDALRTQGWNIPADAVERGIAHAQWPGRFEICAVQPLFIVDGGHNTQGAQALARTLRELLPSSRPVFLIGILADKDYPAMIDGVTPLGSAFVCVTPDNPRALPADELATQIRLRVSAQTPVCTASDFAEAVACSRKLAGPTGIVCAFGSLYSIGNIKAALADLREHDKGC